MNMRSLGTFLLCCVNSIALLSCDRLAATSDRPVGRDEGKPPEQAKTDGKAAPLQLTPEDRVLLDILRERESARARLRAIPGDFIRGEVREKELGFFGSRIQVKTIVFKNTSPFDVAHLKGHIRFSEGTQHLGSLPFVASGSVYAGEAVLLDVQSTDLQGKPDRFDVIIDSVHVSN